MRIRFGIIVLIIVTAGLYAEDGHDLWLRNKSNNPVNISCKENSATIEIAKKELKDNWLGKPNATVTLAIKRNDLIKGDGFKIGPDKIEANTDLGILYGVYELLRQQQTGKIIQEGKIMNSSYERRLLNHWDNQDGTIERGYAGLSIFWHKGLDSLIVTKKDIELWKEYARANASICINGAVLNNVNASPLILTRNYLERVKAIADVLRPYGIKTYLSIKFSSPVLIGGLQTADPLDTDVIDWWDEKSKEIYDLIPDFGGFLVKANSEGQPGPQDYGRTHADGANMLADALKPYGGIVMWRAFVYSPSKEDRAKQAYNEFMPLDGVFHDNVIIQAKNGPVDFQPREPFSPLFGAMKKTSVMPELQITQEYLGQSIHLVYLGTMWEEFLQSDTYQEGEGSTVARCTDGSIYSLAHTTIAGVSNIGLDANWCGHDFAQSNWYAFGRLAWDNTLTSEQIAEEWIKLTFYKPEPNDEGTISFTEEWENGFLLPVKRIMLESREAAVNYMMPLGLHHIFSADEHYGPGPWWAPKGMRKDWTPPYYHQADSNGIGFDRTKTGSNAVSQYHSPLDTRFGDINTCPEEFLLWFHHLSWNYKMKNGNTLWDEICFRYNSGLQEVLRFKQVWDKIQPYIDEDRYLEIQIKLNEQCENAKIWNDACLLYFQQFSGLPFPAGIELPEYKLEELIKKDMKR